MSADTTVPDDLAWGPEIDELRRRRARAEGLGGPDAIDRHHDQGRLTVRERIAGLLDTGSFHEVGQLSGQGRYADDGSWQDTTPAPYVMGTGTIDGRPVAVGGEDFTVRGGTSWGGHRRKGGQGGFIEEVAKTYRIPLVNLIDGAGGTVGSMRRRGYSVFPGVDGFETSVELLGMVPVVSAVMGTAAGGPAGRAILSHYSIMVRGTSQIFAAGPPVVARSLGQKIDKEALGGADVSVGKGGTVDHAVDSEAEAFDLIRRFLSYLPQNVWHLPPRGPQDDPSGRRDHQLANLVPRSRTRPYNMKALITSIADAGSVFECQPGFGKAVICALARFGGHPVGLIANNPMINGGAMDAKAARKQIRFMEVCDTFHIPLLFLVDVPGFMVGLKAEEEGTLRAGMGVVAAAARLSVPTLTVVIRKCYGMAGMATTSKLGPDWKIAWPSAEWGSLPVEGGVAAAFRREIEAAPDPKARERELEEEMRQFASPMRTAEAFAVEDIIDPRDTRPIACRFAALSQEPLSHDLGPRAKSGVMP